MTSGKLLRQLFEGYAQQDDTIFREAATAIVENERAKNHRLLADDLNRILLKRPTKRNKSAPLFKKPEIPIDKERGLPLLSIDEYRYDWDRIILEPETKNRLKRIAKEQDRRDVLAASGLEPKNKILLYGPPGCGKSLSAKILASVLYRPLVTVRLDAVISSYLGETAANLRKIFDFIETGTWVVFFDEFDAIAKDRGSQGEHGELKRVVNTLLQLMDRLKSDSLILAATNYETLLDQAMWRRFDAMIEFPLPEPQDRILLLRLFFKNFDTSVIDFKRLGYALEDANGADIEWLCKETLRHMLLDGRQKISVQDIQFAQHQFDNRREMIKHLKQKKEN